MPNPKELPFPLIQRFKVGAIALIEAADDICGHLEVSRTINFIIHGGLFAGSMIIATDPVRWGWAQPFLQGVGQLMNSPARKETSRAPEAK